MKKFIIGSLLFSSMLFADKVIVQRVHPDFDNPWLTGPLLAPSSAIVPVGHANFEPYIYVIANTGYYDRDWKVKKVDTLWENSFQTFIQVGLTPWMDMEIAPSLTYNYREHKTRWGFGDFPLTFDFQLFSPNHVGDWRPHVKLICQEIFPTGKYRNLDPKKKGVDSTGEGSYQTLLGIVVGKIVHLTGLHFMTPRIFLQYTLPAKTHLKGFNSYGGGYGTNAYFFPAQSFEADFGFEVTLTKTWAFACDFVGTWSGKTHFTGDAGRNADGTKAILGKGSSVQYALAPAIEYNWNDNLGIIGGSWFTVAGRNSARFWSAVFALNYYI